MPPQRGRRPPVEFRRISPAVYTTGRDHRLLRRHHPACEHAGAARLAVGALDRSALRVSVAPSAVVPMRTRNSTAESALSSGVTRRALCFSDSRLQSSVLSSRNLSATATDWPTRDRDGRTSRSGVGPPPAHVDDLVRFHLELARHRVMDHELTMPELYFALRREEVIPGEQAKVLEYML